MRTALAAVLFLGVITAAAADDKKAEPIKVGIDNLNKAWSLKLKSSSVTDKEIKITLEFTKDVEEPVVKMMRLDLHPSEGVERPRDAEHRIYLFYLDEENVVVWKSAFKQLEGDPNGRAGDAFRIIAATPPAERMTRVKKIDLRPVKINKK